MPRTPTMTKNEALRRLCPKGGQHLGDNNLTYGGRSNHVRVALSTNGTSGHYELLRLTHIVDNATVQVWTINMAEKRHIPSPHPFSSLGKGGYYWSQDSSGPSFYGWIPAGTAERVVEILLFTGVVTP